MEARNTSNVATLLRPKQFSQTYPNIASEKSLRHQLLLSGSNGLDAAGAVIRKRVNPESHKPLVFIDVERYFAWLRSEGRAAA